MKTEMTLEEAMEVILQKHIEYPMELMEFQLPGMKEKIIKAMIEVLDYAKQGSPSM